MLLRRCVPWRSRCGENSQRSSPREWEGFSEEVTLDLRGNSGRNHLEKRQGRGRRGRRARCDRRSGHRASTARAWARSPPPPLPSLPFPSLPSASAAGPARVNFEAAVSPQTPCTGSPQPWRPEPRRRGARPGAAGGAQPTIVLGCRSSAPAGSGASG